MSLLRAATEPFSPLCFWNGGFSGWERRRGRAGGRRNNLRRYPTKTLCKLACLKRVNWTGRVNWDKKKIGDDVNIVLSRAIILWEFFCASGEQEVDELLVVCGVFREMGDVSGRLVGVWAVILTLKLIFSFAVV